jgi:hypothetical protein
LQLEGSSGQAITREDVLPYLAKHGLLWIRDADMDDVEQLLEPWTVPYPHPHDIKPGLTLIQPKNAPVLGERGLSTRSLDLHTDRSSSLEPPTILCTLVLSQSSVGGESLFVDGKPLTSRVVAKFSTPVFRELILHFSEGAPRPVFEYSGHGRCRLRYRDDEVGRPLPMTQSAERALRTFKQLLASPQVFTLGLGDGYLIHNHRYLHGRKQFSGQRSVARWLANIKVESEYCWMNSGFVLQESIK